MICITKLLLGKATVSEAIKYSKVEKPPAEMLHFSTKATPIVVWNMTRKCNLKCKHCYIEAKITEQKGELTTEEAKSFIEDLAKNKIPVLLLSGGEPLLREDFFELAEYANNLGLRVVVSTNGTLITESIAERMKDIIQYVGVSLDGLPSTHDKFRGVEGAFDQALKGIKNSLKAGLKTGVRFVVNKENYDELPKLIDFAAEQGIQRFCIYHLVYAGRGKEIIDLDITNEHRRKMMDMLIEKALKYPEMEILTTDNHADGIYLYNYIKKHNEERAEEVLKLLEMHGGCSAGYKFACVDNLGNVHPCQFWSHYTIGNVKEKKFSEIWNGKDELLKKLREKPKHLKGKCKECKYNMLCGGCRVRAESYHTDLWKEDPCCYLEKEEIT